MMGDVSVSSTTPAKSVGWFRIKISALRLYSVASNSIGSSRRVRIIASRAKFSSWGTRDNCCWECVCSPDRCGGALLLDACCPRRPDDSRCGHMPQAGPLALLLELWGDVSPLGGSSDDGVSKNTGRLSSSSLP